jgi:hypothetical protein
MEGTLERSGWAFACFNDADSRIVSAGGPLGGAGPQSEFSRSIAKLKE